MHVKIISTFTVNIVLVAGQTRSKTRFCTRFSVALCPQSSLCFPYLHQVLLGSHHQVKCVFKGLFVLSCFQLQEREKNKKTRGHSGAGWGLFDVRPEPEWWHQHCVLPDSIIQHLDTLSRQVLLIGSQSHGRPITEPFKWLPVCPWKTGSKECDFFMAKHTHTQTHTHKCMYVCMYRGTYPEVCSRLVTLFQYQFNMLVLTQQGEWGKRAAQIQFKKKGPLLMCCQKLIQS